MSLPFPVQADMLLRAPGEHYAPHDWISVLQEERRAAVATWESGDSGVTYSQYQTLLYDFDYALAGLGYPNDSAYAALAAELIPADVDAGAYSNEQWARSLRFTRAELLGAAEDGRVADDDELRRQVAALEDAIQELEADHHVSALR